MDAETYQREAGRTLSGKYHGDKVSMAELRGRMIDGIRAGDALDQVKKALFYGKGDDIGATLSPAASLASQAPHLIAGNGAQAWSEEKATIILHMALGKFTEAAEFLDAVFKALNGESPPDRINLLEEIGDGLWYDANALEALGSSFPAEMLRNNGKLRLRFPDRFTEDGAINRNVVAERTMLEGEAGLGQAIAALAEVPYDRLKLQPINAARAEADGLIEPPVGNRENGQDGHRQV